MGPFKTCLRTIFTFLFIVSILTRLEKLEENQEIVINMLRTALAKVGYDDDDDEDEMFPTSLSTFEELNEVEKKLKQQQPYRRKMVNHYYLYILS